jgi:chemotaxis protein MotB
MVKRFSVAIVSIVSLSLFSGCASLKKLQRLEELERQLAQKDAEIRRLSSEKEKEVSDLERAKQELAQSLQKELGEYKAKLQMTERGLVITFLAEVFFDSGRDQIRQDGKDILAKVAQVLNKDVPDSRVAVEGHTDSDPIKYSGWKSNWELSSARALAVLHYFIDEASVTPERLSANGYGEYKAVASNDTPQGKQQNRRVEIVILPALSKVKAEK